MPLLDQAAAFLDQHLPITDVAQVEMDTARATGQDVSAQIREYLNRATPLIEGKGDNQQVGFVLIPATDAGKAYAELAQQAAPDLQQVRVSGQAHLMFCREQGYLSMDDLHRLMRPYRAAYEEAALIPQASPHSRFDILDWMPLDP
jgi:hypothetical protein